MDVSTLYTTATEQTKTSTVNYPLNASAMVDFNFVYKDFCNEIRKVNEQYFYHRRVLNSSPYESKYLFANGTATVFGLSKVNTVAVKYDLPNIDQWLASTAYKKGETVQNGGLEYIFIIDTTGDLVFPVAKTKQIFVSYRAAVPTSVGPEFIENMTSSSIGIPVFDGTFGLYTAPQYFFGTDRDQATNTITQALYIYPSTKETVIQGILVEGVKTTVDLITTSLEADIQIERDYHDILMYGWKWRIYDKTARDNQAQMARQEYYDIRDRAIRQISDRVLSPTLQSMSFLSEYSY